MNIGKFLRDLQRKMREIGDCMGNFRYRLHTTVLLCSERDFKNAIKKLVLGFTNIEAAINSYAQLHGTKFKRIWK